MTAPLLVSALEPTMRGALFSSCAADKTNKPSSAHRTKQTTGHQPQATNTPLSETSTLNLIRTSLLESLNQGVIVTSRSLNALYWNAKARSLCQHLSGSEFPPLELPAEVSEVCHRLMREHRRSDRPCVMECQTPTKQTIRISARCLELGGAQAADVERHRQPYILVLLENCNDLLHEEIRIERKKYDLTEREAEVWLLLRQEYSYQEIAKMLQISLNTVKTHIKNVYAKKRSCQGREKFWCHD